MTFEISHVADFDERHARDAKKVGRISGEQVGLNDPENLEHERRGRTGDTDVEPAVEEVLFVFHQTEFDQRSPSF